MTPTEENAVPATPPEHVYDTLIVGAGFSGLGAAIKLGQAGVSDVVIIERSDRVGGTWRDNTYPGAACDIPSLLYSFSFAKNPGWSRAYSPSDEIRAHIEELAERYDLLRLIRFGVEVNGLSFDEAAGVWTARTVQGEEFRARTVLLASGPLPDSSFPEMRGIETYEGHKILSSKWDHDYDFTGKRVAVIGTGASAVQIVPELVKQAEFVKVFQRTAGWVMPRWDVPTPKVVQKIYELAPAVQSAARAALFWGHEATATGLTWNTPVTSLVGMLGKAHLRSQVKDPWLRRQLTPNFTPGCKRMLISSDYFPALQQDNCKLIDWPIATLSPVGIRTSDGIEHHLDAIVFATGYDVHLDGPPYPVTGRDGRSMNVEMRDGAQGFKSASVSGYPNLFLMTGPNSGPGHNSLLVFVEGQLDYAVTGITTILDQDLRYLDVLPEVQAAYNVSLQKRLKRTTWATGCSSWYLTKDGFNASMFPGFASQYLRQMRDFQPADYEMVPNRAKLRPVVSVSA